MTAFQHYELLCDADGCDESFNAGEPRAITTRNAAAKVGWLHVFKPGGWGKGKTLVCKDYCAKHADAVEEHQP